MTRCARRRSWPGPGGRRRSWWSRCGSRRCRPEAERCGCAAGSSGSSTAPARRVPRPPACFPASACGWPGASARRATGQPAAAVLTLAGPPERLGRPPPLQTAAGDLRAGLRRAADGLPPEERGLLPGLVLGDTSRLPADLQADFRTAGLTHLVAVSGANLAIVSGFVLLLGRWGGLRGRALPLLAAASIAGFVVLARPEPSVLRAAAMGALALLALATGRRRRSLAALAATVVVLLLVDPWLSRSYGFVLSALATGALVTLATCLDRALVERRCPAPAGRGARGAAGRPAGLRAGGGAAQRPGQPGRGAGEPPRRAGRRPGHRGGRAGDGGLGGAPRGGRRRWPGWPAASCGGSSTSPGGRPACPRPLSAGQGPSREPRCSAR